MKKEKPITLAMDADGDLAATAKGLEYRPLEVDCLRSVRITGGQEPIDFLRPNLEGDCRLAGSRDHLFHGKWFKAETRKTIDPESMKSSRCQDGCIRQVILGNLGKASADVAANFLPFSVGIANRQLAASARTAGGDDLGLGNVFANDEDVAGILSREVTCEGKPVRHLGRKVLGAVNGEVRPLFQESYLQLLGKQTFATLLLERPLEALVPRG